MLTQHRSRIVLAFSLTCLLMTTSSLQAQVDQSQFDQSQFDQGQFDQDQVDQGQGFPQQQPQSAQAQGFPTQRAQAGPGFGASANPNAAALAQIQGLINNEAQFGRTPANSRFLADLQNLVGRYTFAPAAVPKVNITNRGGGVLRILKPDGSSFDLNAFSSTQTEIGPGRTTLIALGGDVHADFSLSGNVPCKMHDCDRNGGGNFELNAMGARRAGGGAQRFYPFDRMFSANKNGCYYLEP